MAAPKKISLTNVPKLSPEALTELIAVTEKLHRLNSEAVELLKVTRQLLEKAQLQKVLEHIVATK